MFQCMCEYVNGQHLFFQEAFQVDLERDILILGTWSFDAQNKSNEKENLVS